MEKVDNKDMNININEIQCITDHLQDDISKTIFANRLLYSMTEENGFMRNIFMTLPEGILFDNAIKAHKNQKLILFGAGQWGRWTKNTYNNIGWDCFADNKVKERYIAGIPVISVEELVSNYKDAFIVITSKFHCEEIKMQLCDAGFKHENLYLFGKMICEIENRIYFDLPALSHDENEVFIDAGGYNGRTSADFCKWAGDDRKKIYIFEPDIESQTKCKNTLNGIPNVEIIPQGLWNSESRLHFVTNGSESKIIDDISKNGGAYVPVTTLDGILQGERATFIKMDIEGSEMNALVGSEGTIRQYKPKLAISIYHKPDDIVEIPKLLLQFNPEYRFWIRHYSLSWFDTVLYAI